MDNLPAILHHDDNLKQAKTLLEACKNGWEKARSETFQKSALVFDNPLET